MATLASTTAAGNAALVVTDELGLGRPEVAVAVMLVALLMGVLVGHRTSVRHFVAAFWLAMLLIDAIGALLPAALHHGAAVSPWVTTATLAVGLGVALVAWSHAGTILPLSSIATGLDEGFAWGALVTAAALGSSLGYLLTTDRSLSRLPAVALVGFVITLIAAAYWKGGLDGRVGFWAVLVLCRPLGAALSHLFAATRQGGGLGLGATWTVALTLALMMVAVSWATLRARNRPPAADASTCSGQR